MKRYPHLSRVPLCSNSVVCIIMATLSNIKVTNVDVSPEGKAEEEVTGTARFTNMLSKFSM